MTGIGRGHTIEAGGGLQQHLAMLGIKWEIWVLLAEANWNPQLKRYRAIKAMARILGVSDAAVIKWLKIYDNEIGRTRT